MCHFATFFPKRRFRKDYFALTSWRTPFYNQIKTKWNTPFTCTLVWQSQCAGTVK
jgi:hypothetical protein